MREWLAIAFGLAAASSVSCGNRDVFQCQSDTECSGSGGHCEAEGYCSFPDPGCDSGRRFGALSGSELSGSCVLARGSSTAGDPQTGSDAGSSSTAVGDTLALGTDTSSTGGFADTTTGRDTTGSTGRTATPDATLLFIDNDFKQLMRLRTGEQTVETLCEIGGADSYTALEVLASGRLIASGLDSVLEVDRCTCETQPQIPLPNSGFGSLAQDPKTEAIYTVSKETDELFTFEVGSAAVMQVGPLGVTVDNQGGTWSPFRDAMLLLDAGTDTLYQVDISTGQAKAVAVFDLDFSSAGIAASLDDDFVFACSNDLGLFRLNLDGSYEILVDQVLPNCINLAVDPELDPPC
ncbi:MAG: hypothetical protein AAF721_41590 [Myxococcota bacterium]